jgi:hypothetical protein
MPEVRFQNDTQNSSLVCALLIMFMREEISREIFKLAKWLILYLLVAVLILAVLGLIISWVNYVLVCIYCSPLILLILWIASKVSKIDTK